MLDSRLPSVKNQEASYLNHRFDSTEEAKAQIWLFPSLLNGTFFTLALALFAKVLLYTVHCIHNTQDISPSAAVSPRSRSPWTARTAVRKERVDLQPGSSAVDGVASVAANHKPEAKQRIN